MTFSIAARDPRAGTFGVAIASSSPAVAARCAYVRSGIGAACTQNVTDPRLGPALLDLIAKGQNPAEAIETLVATTDHMAHRQLSVIGASGPPAAYSGKATLGTHNAAEAADAVTAGNLLANPDIPAAMAEAFEGEQDLPDRLLAALEAGLEAGGEAGPVRSAGLLIAADVPWPVADLRVDWHQTPIAELRRLWMVYAPQLDDYVTRALDPTRAPAYGVPGDREAPPR